MKTSMMHYPDHRFYGSYVDFKLKNKLVPNSFLLRKCGPLCSGQHLRGHLPAWSKCFRVGDSQCAVRGIKQ